MASEAIIVLYPTRDISSDSRELTLPCVAKRAFPGFGPQTFLTWCQVATPRGRLGLQRSR
jgi:hypothetical protein